MDDFSDHYSVDKDQPQEADVVAEAAARDDRAGNCQRVFCDLPSRIPVDRGEIAILRAFLSADIRAIIEGVDLPAVE